MFNRELTKTGKFAVPPNKLLNLAKTANWYESVAVNFYELQIFNAFLNKIENSMLVIFAVINILVICFVHEYPVIKAYLIFTGREVFLQFSLYSLCFFCRWKCLSIIIDQSLVRRASPLENLVTHTMFISKSQTAKST